MPVFNGDIKKLAKANTDFRREIQPTPAARWC